MLFLRAEKKGQFKIQINQQFCKTIEGRKKKKNWHNKTRKVNIGAEIKKKKKRERNRETANSFFFFRREATGKPYRGKTE